MSEEQKSTDKTLYGIAQEWLHSTDQTTQAMVATLVERANEITKTKALKDYKAELVRRIDEEKIDKLFVQVSPVHMIGFDVAPTFNEALDRVKEIIN